jgi:putative transposase
MLNIEDLSRIKGFRFPKSVIGYAVWAYHRFALSLRDVEDLLAERGFTVSYETIRDWVNRFGHGFAAKIRRDRPAPADKWHLDEVVVRIKGKTHWLWRAVDANGDVLDGLCQVVLGGPRNRKSTMTSNVEFASVFGPKREGIGSGMAIGIS